MIKRFIKDTKKYFPFAVFSAKAELKSEISNSYLSWIWLVLEPFCFMLIYTFIVTIVFHSTEPYLPIFVFIGLTIWNFFNRMVISSVKLVRTYKGVVSKTYVPKYVLLFIRTIKNGFKMLISLGIVFVMMIYYKVPITWNVLYLGPVLLLLVIGTFAACTVLMHFGTFVDDLSNIVTILMRLAFYVSGIFYSLPQRVPQPLGGWLVYYNPVAFVINETRNILLFGQPIYYKWYVAWMIFSLVFAAIGISLIYRYENVYAKVI